MCRESIGWSDFIMDQDLKISGLEEIVNEDAATDKAGTRFNISSDKPCLTSEVLSEIDLCRPGTQ